MTLLLHSSYSNPPQDLIPNGARKIWIDASKINGGGANPSDGSPISSVANLFAPTVPMTQATVSRRPLFVVSGSSAPTKLPVIRFDGIDDGMSTDPFQFNFDQFALFVAGYFPSTTDFQQMFMEYGINADTNSGFYFSGKATPYGAEINFPPSNTIYNSSAPADFPGNSFCVLSLIVTLAGGNIQISINKNEANIGNGGGTSILVDAATESFNLGYRNGGAGSFFMQGDVGELILLQGVLSTIKINSITNYLLKKWMRM